MKTYSSYKLSGIDWIGEIPSSWECARLKYFIEISNGSDPKTEGNTPVYGTGERPFKTCGEYKLGPTILLGRKGTIDTPHWIDGLYWNVDTAFDTKAKGEFNLRFFWYIANCINLEPYKSTTAVPSMTQSAYENIMVPIPSPDEQVAVAGYLDDITGKIDELMNEKRSQVENLHSYRTSLITEVVTRGLNPDAFLAPSGIDTLPKIPEHWGIMKLGFIADIQTGTTPKTSEEKYWENPNRLWFTPSDFNNLILNNSNRKVSEIAYKEKACKVFPKNTVLLVGIGATLGKVGISYNECSANQQINAIIFSDKMRPKFGAYYLTSIQDLVKSFSNAATLPILNQEQVKNLQILIPPIDEQQEIADFLDEKTGKIDELIDELEEQLKELSEYKKAVITEAVTGKVDVRDWKAKD